MGRDVHSILWVGVVVASQGAGGLHVESGCSAHRGGYVEVSRAA